jgi:hypothetical protein
LKAGLPLRPSQPIDIDVQPLSTARDGRTRRDEQSANDGNGLGAHDVFPICGIGWAIATDRSSYVADDRKGTRKCERGNHV